LAAPILVGLARLSNRVGGGRTGDNEVSKIAFSCWAWVGWRVVIDSAQFT
jgi:hypothetical protein